LEKIRCAVVGLGRIGWRLEEDRLREKPCTHAGAICRDPDCTLVGGCDIDPRRCSAFSRRYVGVTVTTDLDVMMRTVSPEIVHIATPADTHLQVLERALSHNPRLFVCEKPLAGSVREAARLAGYQESGRARILVNHPRRYSKDYQRVKAHLDGGSFGVLLSVHGRLSFGAGEPALEVLLHDGTHLIDVVQYLVAAPLRIRSAERFGRDEAESIALCCQADAVPVLVEVGTGRDYVQFELDLSFSQGRIRIGNGLYEEHRSGKSPYYENMRSLRRKTSRRPGKTGYFRNMVADAARCARDPDRVPLSTAIDGYSVVQFVDSVRQLLAD